MDLRPEVGRSGRSASVKRGKAAALPYHLLRLAQYGDGARASARFTGQKDEAHETIGPLTEGTLKRRERRAPVAPSARHSITRASISSAKGNFSAGWALFAGQLLPPVKKFHWLPATYNLARCQHTLLPSSPGVVTGRVVLDR